MRRNDDPGVDLTNCDREPIHIPGSIQPHGCLLACDASAAKALRRSANAASLLGLDGEINGRLLDDIIGVDPAHAIRNALSRTNEAQRAALLFGVALPNGRVFDVAAHRHKGSAIIEFEPAIHNAAQPLELARSLIGRIAAIGAIEKLVANAARLIRAALGYDRVMVYQFFPDGSGKVLSEAKRGHLESFLGQYFPASDIPQQARTLYLRNTIRIISDANFERIPIEPTLDDSGEALDLSFAHLRSVSPIHCEYLRNMGVGASMSISIVVDGALWGLIACHHYAPRMLTIGERVAAEMFGDFFSLHLSALKQKNKLDAATHARESLDRFLRMATSETDVDAALRGNLADFATLVPCDGVGLWLRGAWTSIGAAPPPAGAESLAAFARTVAEGRVWATHHLARHLPGAEDYAPDAAGLMITPLSQRPRDYLFFFRKELTQTLNWGGDPEKSYETGPLGDRLTPRKSFAIWKETVHSQSPPWSDEERQIGEATRVALVEVLLRHNELLEDERAKAEVRQRMLNEELNHRVKNILAVIKSLVSHPIRDGDDLAAYAASLRGRIQALAYAHDQVVRGDGGGSLADLIDAELGAHRGATSAIAIDGPPAWIDARAFSVLALVLHELATNAAKYGALSRDGGALAIAWRFDEGGSCEIEWRESGGPPVKPPRRRGFGTTLIDRGVPFDLGGESDVRYAPEGLQARFRIPARHVSRDARSASAKRPAAAPPRGATADLSETRVLVVEDQMLIAMDLEQMLGDHGATDVITAGSTAEALDKLRGVTPDVAILDVNLGSETSARVAEELTRRGVPFAFATGYSDRSMISAQFSAAPVVRKPYEATAIVNQIARLLKRP